MFHYMQDAAKPTKDVLIAKTYIGLHIHTHLVIAVSRPQLEALGP